MTFNTFAYRRSAAARYNRWVRESDAAAGAAAKQASTRLLLAGAGLLSLLGGAALLLAGNLIWTERVHHGPASPTVLALLLLVLALMMIALAALRWLRASTARRPGWQRAHAVVLALAAAYLLGRALSLA